MVYSSEVEKILLICLLLLPICVLETPITNFSAALAPPTGTVAPRAASKESAAIPLRRLNLSSHVSRWRSRDAALPRSPMRQNISHCLGCEQQLITSASRAVNSAGRDPWGQSAIIAVARLGGGGIAGRCRLSDLRSRRLRRLRPRRWRFARPKSQRRLSFSSNALCLWFPRSPPWRIRKKVSTRPSTAPALASTAMTG